MIYVLIIIAAIAKAVMDRSSEGDFNSPFWNKAESAGYKWKNGKDSSDGEKFPGSSTVFVFATDGWHLAQFFFLNSIFACFLIFIVWWKVLVLRIVFGMSFEGAYRLLKKG